MAHFAQPGRRGRPGGVEVDASEPGVVGTGGRSRAGGATGSSSDRELIDESGRGRASPLGSWEAAILDPPDAVAVMAPTPIVDEHDEQSFQSTID
jgi:hypothetical protein